MIRTSTVTASVPVAVIRTGAGAGTGWGYPVAEEDGMARLVVPAEGAETGVDLLLEV